MILCLRESKMMMILERKGQYRVLEEARTEVVMVVVMVLVMTGWKKVRGCKYFHGEYVVLVMIMMKEVMMMAQGCV